MIKLLVTYWKTGETSSYFLDKDEDSIAHEYSLCCTLDTFSGKYVYDKRTGTVTLDDGYRVINKDNIDKWCIEYHQEEA